MKVPFLLSIFYMLVFVVMGRPQDIAGFMALLRPALVLEALLLVFTLMHLAQLVSNVSFRNKQVVLFSALVCIIMLSTPFALHRGLALTFVFTEYVSVVLFFFFFFLIATSNAVVKNVFRTACLAIAVYTIFSLVGGRLNQGRLGVGEMFDPNDLAYVFISILPLNFLFLARENPLYMRCVSIFNICFGSLAVLMTGSRGGFIGLLVVFIMLLFSKTRSVRFGHKVVFVVLCLALVIFKSNSIDFERLSTTFQPEKDYNVTDEFGRVDLWKMGLNMMLTHPLTGVGPNCFPMAVAQDREARGSIPRWQTAHNSLVPDRGRNGDYWLHSLYSFEFLCV